MIYRRDLLCAGAATAAMLAFRNAAAQSLFTKAVEIVVPFSPGGSVDTAARLYQNKLAPKLGQPVVVDNRGGASGNVGTAYVARSPADGHRLLFATSNLLTVNPHIFKTPGFDPFKDFAPVSLLCNGALAFAVHADSGIKTLPDLISAAKQKPRSIFYGTPSAGTPQHLMAELLNQLAGIDMTPVHYKGVTPAILDLIGGHVQVAVSTYAALKPHVEAGKVRILAVAESKRLSNVPMIPTVAEFYPGFEMTTWFGIFAPAATPKPVVARLQDLFVEATASKDVRDTLESLALPPVGGNAEQLAKVLRRDYETLGALVRSKKISAE